MQFFLKATGSQILAFSMAMSSDRTSMHAMIKPCIGFDLFCVFIDDGVIIRVGPWRGFKFLVI